MTKDKQKFIFFFSFIFSVFSFFSCRPAIEPISFRNSTAEVNFSAEFENFWNVMNRNYLFWDIDPTDWDDVYVTYKPRFDALGIVKNDATNKGRLLYNSKIAYEYFREMTANLIDGHYKMFFDTKLSKETAEKYAGKYPELVSGDKLANLSPVRKIDDDNENKNSIFKNKVWKGNWSSPDKMKNPLNCVIKPYFNTDIINTDTRPFARQNDFTIGYGHIDISQGGYILYVYFSSFDLTKMQYDPVVASVSDLLYEIFGDLYNANDNGEFAKEGVKGVIIDIRGNGGGYIIDLSYLWGRFIDRNLTFAYTRGKTGDNRLDYTPWMPFKITPAPVEKRVKNLNVPVALLVDRFSISCSEFSAMIVKALPNHKIIGETTYGATSPVGASDDNTFNVIFNGGGYYATNPILWSYIYTPYNMTKCFDGNIYEGTGVPPELSIPADNNYWTAFATGHDKRLEAAIHFIDPEQY